MGSECYLGRADDLTGKSSHVDDSDSVRLACFKDELRVVVGSATIVDSFWRGMVSVVVKSVDECGF